MNTYSLSDEAIRDLEELYDYIAQNEPKVASRIFGIDVARIVSGYRDLETLFDI